MAPVTRARSRSASRTTSILDLPADLLGCVLQEARKGTKGERFLTYATVSRSWHDASVESVQSVFLREHQEVAAALAGGLDRFLELKCVGIRGFQGIQLPPDLGARLKRLETLQLKNCPNLKALPESIGEMTSLKKLNLINLPGLPSLPPFLLHMTSLESLTISDCQGIMVSTRGVPEPLGTFPRLRYLHFSCFSLASLPPGFPALKKLKLELHWDPVPEGLEDAWVDGLATGAWRSAYSPLPNSSYPSLEHLTIISPYYTFVLPLMICELQRLKYLEIWARELTVIPEDIGNLQQLQDLRLLGCENLESIPEAVFSISALESLTLEATNFMPELQLPPRCNLKQLDLRGCEDLEEVHCPGGSVAVKELRVSCYHVEGTGNAQVPQVPRAILSDTLLGRLHILKVVHEEPWGLRRACPGRCLPATVGTAGALQVLDLSEAPCVVDFSSCYGLTALKEVKLSPDWPQQEQTSWQSQVAAVHSALELLKLPNLGDENKRNLIRRCREVLQDALSQEQQEVSEEGILHMTRLAGSSKTSSNGSLP